MNGSKEIGPQISNINDSSDDDEVEVDAILASLIAQLDNLECQQHESITLVHDQLQKQRHAVDALRKSVREAESVIHQKRFSRQRAKIKRLRKVNVAGAPVYHSTTSGVSSKQAENWSPIVKTTTPTPRLASGSTPSVTQVGESPVNNHHDVVMGSDDDDGHSSSVSLHSPVAHPMEITESRGVGKKLTTTKSVPDIVVKKVAEKATEVEKKSHFVPKMRPTRGRGGRGGRGRGGTMRGITSRQPKGGSVVDSISSRPDSREHEPVVAPPPARGYGTARRAKPFKRGGAAARSSSSAMESDTGENIPTPRAKPTSLLSSVSGFGAFSRPTPPIGPGRSNWIEDWQTENGAPLSTLPAGAGVVRTGSSPLKSLPPPRSKDTTMESPGSSRRNSKRLHTEQDLPAYPALFSSKDLRAIFGGGNPGSVIVNVTKEGQQNAVVEYPTYICLSPDAHFDPPGTMCDNAAILDVDGQEGLPDSQAVYPVWKKVGKAWMYCGDYTQGERETVSVDTWNNSNISVRKYWAKKIRDTEWGREFLVRKGFRLPGEMRNIPIAEILGYFSIPDDRKGLRLSATTLNFETFNRSAYDRMVAKAEVLNPAGLLQAPMSKLGPNNFSTKPRTSLLAAGDSDSPKVTDAPTPLRERKRRRIEAASDEEGEVKKVEAPVVSQKRLPLVESERGRRTSRNEVNYRIAPLSEFAGELERTGGTKEEIIELVSDDDGDFQSQKKVDEEEEEDEEEEGEGGGEGGGEGEGEGEMEMEREGEGEVEGEEEEEEEEDDEEAGESEGEMLID